MSGRSRLAERFTRVKPIPALETGDPAQDLLLARAGVEVVSSLDALIARLERVSA